MQRKEFVFLFLYRTVSSIYLNYLLFFTIKEHAFSKKKDPFPLSCSCVGIWARKRKEQTDLIIVKKLKKATDHYKYVVCLTL